jgi:hypothetical protein
MDVPDEANGTIVLGHVRKFVATTKAHRQSLDRTTTI